MSKKKYHIDIASMWVTTENNKVVFPTTMYAAYDSLVSIR